MTLLTCQSWLLLSTLFILCVCCCSCSPSLLPKGTGALLLLPEWREESSQIWDHPKIDTNNEINDRDVTQILGFRSILIDTQPLSEHSWRTQECYLQQPKLCALLIQWFMSVLGHFVVHSFKYQNSSAQFFVLKPCIGVCWTIHLGSFSLLHCKGMTRNVWGIFFCI